MAESFVAMKCIEAQDFEYCHLEDEVNPRITDEHRKEKYTDSRIESQDVAERHERQALLAELLSHRSVGRQILYQRPECLELRRLSFLGSDVSDIEEEVELLEPLLFVPLEALHPHLLFSTGIQFAALVTLRYPKMDIAVIVGNATLT